MCEHCGCREVEPIAELMDEHTALVDEAHHLRQALRAGNRTVVMSRLERLVGHLDRHVRREEAGIFRALRGKGEFLVEVEELEGEHRTFNETIADLDFDSADFVTRVTRLLADLDVHVERENLGIFHVSTVTLGAAGWQIVDEAHAESPSFLLDPGAPSYADPRALRQP